MKKILIDVPQQIETPRLKMVMPKAGFSAALHAAILDGYVDYVRYLNWPPEPPTIEAVEEENRKNHAEFILRDFIRYLVIDKTTDAVLGRCALPPAQANWLIPQFGISYFIRKSARGKGYASEAALALAHMVFKILKAQKVEIYCETENSASKRIPEKIGLKLEYNLRGGWPRPDGKLASQHVFSAFSESELQPLEIQF